jgi:polyferredoxin
MDLLRLPLVGSVLRWPRFRLVLRLVLLASVVAIVLHGMLGPQIGPRNLATVTTAIHWRGLLIVALLLVGNLFCTACPMMLVRDAGRRFVHPRLRWPRWLRRKWLALGLLVAALFSYELWNLWELPRATAWLIVGYFALALAVDLTFKGASFCKYVCPVGQFNFAASTLSPTELQVRNADVCRTCRTKDCIRGRYTPGAPVTLVRRGCELGLYLPAKVGNLDCTMCLDCVHACPHDNIALATRMPGVEWLVPGRRSGLGRVTARTDLAALSLAFTFGGLLTAFAMTAPSYALQAWLRTLGLVSEAQVLAFLFVAALLVLPAVCVLGAATATRRLSGTTIALRAAALPYACALLPLGFGVWLAHYGFHLLTGVLTIVPVAQSAAIDAAGFAMLGEPAWSWIGMRSGTVFPIQVGFVLLGAAGSVGLVRAISTRDYPARSGLVSVPWLVVVIALAAIALWVFVQPMDMRATSPPG